MAGWPMGYRSAAATRPGWKLKRDSETPHGKSINEVVSSSEDEASGTRQRLSVLQGRSNVTGSLERNRFHARAVVSTPEGRHQVDADYKTPVRGQIASEGIANRIRTGRPLPPRLTRLNLEQFMPWN